MSPLSLFPLPVLLLASGIKEAGTDISGSEWKWDGVFVLQKTFIILYKSPGSLLPHFIALGKDLDMNGKDKRHASCVWVGVCPLWCLVFYLTSMWPSVRQSVFSHVLVIPCPSSFPPLPASDLFSVHLCFVWKDELSGVYHLGSLTI